MSEKKLTEIYIHACEWSSIKFPQLANRDTKVTNELKKSLKFLKWGIEPHEVITLSRLVLIVTAVIAILINIVYLLNFSPSIIILSTNAVVPFLFAYLITEYPKNEAALERIDAIGSAPTVLTQIVIFLKQNPNLERALQFVTKYSEGRISKELKEVLWKCMMGQKTSIKEALISLAQQWGEYLVDLKRSLYLIVASVSERNEVKRNQSLDRALKISLDGLINKIKEYANNLYLPTLFLFSFGTVLPLVIISLLPIFSFLGGEFSSPLQMFLILTVSIVVIYFYSNKIISKRPPSFASIKLPKDLSIYPKANHLKIKVGKRDIEFPALPYLILTFLVIGFPGIFYLLSETSFVKLIPNTFTNILNSFNTLTLIWAFGIVIAVYSYGTSWYKKEIRKKIKRLEIEAVDGFYQLASRIDEGRSPEEAIKFVGESMPNTEFGKLMKKTYNTLRSRHTTLEKALFDEEYGTLNNVYSKNVKLMFRVFLTSLKKGVSNSAQMLFTISNHYDQLNRTEEKLKSTLKNALSMMRTTASIFAPMITGLVITLQQLIQNGLKSVNEGLNGMGYLNLSFLTTPNFSVEILQLISGIYMILLAWLLIRYVSLLEYGKDEVMLKTELAQNVPIALFIFTLTLIGSRIVLGA